MHKRESMIAATRSSAESRRILCTMGIGENYFHFGLCMLASAIKYTEDTCDYVMFHANITEQSLVAAKKRMPFIVFEPIDAEIGRILSSEENRIGGFYYRKLKAVPFLHKSYLSRSMLFLDADCLCYSKDFLGLFDTLEHQGYLIYGSYQDKFNTSLYQGVPIAESALKAGIPGVAPMGIHTGVMGRTSDVKSLRLFENFHKVMNMNFLKFKPHYYNDEPYFVVAYQMTFPPPRDINTLPSRRICATPQFCIALADKTKGEDSDGFPIVQKHWCDDLCDKTSVYHFIAAPKNSYYLAKVENILKDHEISFAI